MVARIVESLKHIFNVLVSAHRGRKSQKQPKRAPLILSSNIRPQSSESVRESYYKGNLGISAVLPWCKDGKMMRFGADRSRPRGGTNTYRTPQNRS